jgi:hypothetical protein
MPGPCCLTAIALVSVAVLFAPSADASHRCLNVQTRYLSARGVTTFGQFSCKPARALVRRYFRKVVATGQTEGGCAQLRLTSSGCEVGNFVCRTTRTRTLRGRCSDGLHVVRFLEVDRGPDG